MRLQGQIIAVTVAVMLILTVLVIYLDPFKEETPYVMVQTDRDSYTVGEEITFKLVSISENADFQANGDLYDSGIYIRKLPEGIGPDETLTDHTVNWATRLWLTHGPQVKFPYFNGSDELLELHWDGTYTFFNETRGEYEPLLATSGYYFMVAKLFVTTDDLVKTKVNASSIFYLSSLNVAQHVSYDNVTGNLSLDLDISGGLFDDVEGRCTFDIVRNNGDLGSGGGPFSTNGTSRLFSMTLPDFHPESDYLRLEGFAVSNVGTFAFGVMTSWEEGTILSYYL